MKFKRIIFWMVVLYASVIALGTMGVDVTAIVASLGLVGFALGYALRDLVGNLVAGMVIKATKQYKVGDNVKIANFQGLIESINLRYTTLLEVVSPGESIDTVEVRHYIPNQMVFKTPVTMLEEAE